MKTQLNTTKIRVQVITAAKRDIDPEKLWFDTDIEPEKFVELDPLDITSEMTDWAEQPELGDYILTDLAVRRFSPRKETWVFQGPKESPEAFIRRLRGEGSN